MKNILSYLGCGMLENSEEQTRLLRVITNNLDEELEEVEVEVKK